MRESRMSKPYSLYRCEICKHYTNNEGSVGVDSFIVCNDCYNTVVKLTGKADTKNMLTVLNVFFAIGKAKDLKAD